MKLPGRFVRKREGRRAQETAKLLEARFVRRREQARRRAQTQSQETAEKGEPEGEPMTGFRTPCAYAALRASTHWGVAVVGY